MKHYPYIEVNIYEDTMYPVVSHIFYGKTLKEAKSYLTAHMGTDSFLREALKTGYFKGMKVQVEVKQSDGD